MFQQCAVVPIDYAFVAHEGGMLYLTPQRYLSFCKKGAVEFWKVGLPVRCLARLQSSRLLSLLKKKRSSSMRYSSRLFFLFKVILLWITLKPASCQWYLCGVFSSRASLREVIGSGSSGGLVFLSSALYQSRNDCNTAPAQDPYQSVVSTVQQNPLMCP